MYQLMIGTFKRIKWLPIAIVILIVQFIILSSFTDIAEAKQICISDNRGLNEEPKHLDRTKLRFNKTNNTLTSHTKWNRDDDSRHYSKSREISTQIDTDGDYYMYSVQAEINKEETKVLPNTTEDIVNTPNDQTVVSEKNYSAIQNESINVSAYDTNATTAGNQLATITTTNDGLTETSSIMAVTTVESASSSSRNFAIASLALFAIICGSLWYGISRYLDKNET